MINFTYNNIQYSTLTTDTVQVGLGLSYSPYTSAVSPDFSENVQIPCFVENASKKYTVTSVGRHAFYQCVNISEIILPNTIKILCWSCFFGMTNLSKLVIPPDSQIIIISSDFIRNCPKLTHFFIPKTVKKLTEYTFRVNTNVEFHYCGRRQFSLDFITYDALKPDVVIHVPYNFPYETFGNLTIAKDSFCVPHNDATCNRQRTQQMPNFVFSVAFLIVKI